MTASERELAEQYSRARQLPRGPARFAAVDSVLRQADAAELTAFGFRTRMHAMDDFRTGGDTTRTFLAFSWCLARYDDQPDVVDSGAAEDLMWRYKWVASDLVDFPEVPLDRTNAVLDDMQRRYQLAGYSPHPVHEQRWENADHVGDFAGAAHWYEQMLTAKRDDMSNCRACVPTSQSLYHTSLGEYDKAVEVAAPGLSGGCAHQPQRILTALLRPLLFTGQLERAVLAHREAYPKIKADRLFLGSIAQHIRFCALTGNEARGLELIEHHLSWLERPASPNAEMQFLASSALVLRRLRELGRGDLVIERISEDGTRRTETTVDDLHPEFVAAARAIAVRFDERNGTSNQSTRLEAIMADEPIVASLALTVLAGRPMAAANPAVSAALAAVGDHTAAGDTAAAARAKLTLAAALRDAKQFQDAVEAAEEARLSLRRAGLADDGLRALYLLFQLYHRSYATRDQAISAFDELIGAPALPADLPSMADLLGEAAQELGGSEAIDWRLRAASLHHAAGDVVAERAALTAALAAAADDADRPDGLGILERLDAIGPGPLDNQPQQLAAARNDVCGGALLARAGQLEASLTRLDQAVARYEAAGLPASAPRTARTWRARVLLQLGRLAEAEAEAQDVWQHEGDSYAWNARVVIAQAMLAQGRDAEAAVFMAKESLQADRLEFDDDFDDLDDDEDL